jgi:glutamine synthetase
MANQPTLKTVIEKLAAAKTEKVKLAVTDIDGILRGKVISRKRFWLLRRGFWLGCRGSCL